MGKSRYINEIVSHGAETTTYVKAYMQRQIEFFKLEATEKASEAGAALTLTIAMVIAICMIVVFLSVALALWLGVLMSSVPWGFASVAGLYILIALVLRAFRESFRISLQDSIIAFLNKEKDA